MLQVFDEVAARPFLSMGQRFQHAMLFEQLSDLNEPSLQPLLGVHRVAHV
jgi:hypothetical protein